MDFTTRKIEVICTPTKQTPFAIINKPSGLPSAPISADDKNNAFCQTAELFPELLKVSGKKEIEHGLLHRLDTVTSGLILIAATQEFYDFIQKEQQSNNFIKYYKAECNREEKNPKLLDNFPPEDFDSNANIFRITSYFRNFGKGAKEIRPVTQNSNKAALQKIGKPKLYTTEVIQKSKLSENNYEILCKITQGYRHQVRCHLAWAGYPIINDSLYNYEYRILQSNNEQIKFTACGIEFINPITNKKEIFKI